MMVPSIVRDVVVAVAEARAVEPVEPSEANVRSVLPAKTSVSISSRE